MLHINLRAAHQSDRYLNIPLRATYAWLRLRINQSKCDLQRISLDVLIATLDGKAKYISYVRRCIYLYVCMFVCMPRAGISLAIRTHGHPCFLCKALFKVCMMSQSNNEQVWTDGLCSQLLILCLILHIQFSIRIFNGHDNIS